MLLHVHEWGDPGAPPLVCVHGVSAHGARFRRLAEERLAQRFHVLAPDLRGHGRSGWDAPWSLDRHLDDVVETMESAGVGAAVWMGHSYGGRLVFELAARDPGRVERAILLDPAIQLLPHVSTDFADLECRDNSVASVEEATAKRLGSMFPPPPAVLAEELREHLVAGPDGRFRYRYSPAAVVTMYSDMATAPPALESLSMPTLLVHATDFGLVREEQLAALDGLVQSVGVPGGHVVYWDAYEQTLAAIEGFLD
jgi:lipase